MYPIGCKHATAYDLIRKITNNIMSCIIGKCVFTYNDHAMSRKTFIEIVTSVVHRINKTFPVMPIFDYNPQKNVGLCCKVHNKLRIQINAS